MGDDRVAEAATRLERGLWRLLVRWLRVPQRPPELPGGPRDRLEVFLPAPAYLGYLRCEALVTAALIVLVAAAGGVITLLAGEAVVGWVLLGAAPVVAVIGAMLALLARLRVRTMWYALGERALRARYGLWTIHELTITYENIQNINVNQGPLMRLFGLWKLDVQTAGGSRKARQAGNPMQTGLMVALQVAGSLLPGGAAFAGVGGASRRSRAGAAPTGTILGLRDPLPVRDRILARVRRSRSAGLGDERFRDERAGDRARRAVTAAHVDALRAIRDALAAAGPRTAP